MRGSENICFVGVHIFKVAVRFPWSASISRRYLCSVTIGALASGILLFSERPGVWRKCNVKFFCEVRSSAGQWKKKPTDRQKRPGHRTRTSTKCQVFPAKPEKDQRPFRATLILRRFTVLRKNQPLSLIIDIKRPATTRKFLGYLEFTTIVLV